MASAHSASPPQGYPTSLLKGHLKNRSLDLRETVVVGEIMENGETDSVFKMQRQLFARSERVKGIDFHPVEPWILTTLYSGMFVLAMYPRIERRTWGSRIVLMVRQVMFISGLTKLRYAFCCSDLGVFQSRITRGQQPGIR